VFDGTGSCLFCIQVTTFKKGSQRHIQQLTGIVLGAVKPYFLHHSRQLSGIGQQLHQPVPEH
jgi:hypothetical protein